METCSVFPMLNCNLNGRKSFETALFDASKKAEIASTQNVEKNLATDDRSPYTGYMNVRTPIRPCAASLDQRAGSSIPLLNSLLFSPLFLFFSQRIFSLPEAVDYQQTSSKGDCSGCVGFGSAQNLNQRICSLFASTSDPQCENSAGPIQEAFDG